MNSTPSHMAPLPLAKAVTAILTIVLSHSSIAQDANEEDAHNPLSNTALQPESRVLKQGESYAPYAGSSYPTKLLWGDTHVHSSLSLDANSAGNQRLPPEAAYRFARGEEVIANNGMKAKLGAPLDFLVVSDHAEYLGLIGQLRRGDQSLATTTTGRELLRQLGGGEKEVEKLFTDLAQAFIESDPKFDTFNFTFDNWKYQASTADQFNQPGVFSAIIGYEWTPFPQGDNLHRVVIYRDGADKAAAMRPFSSLDGKDPEELWDFMENYEANTDGGILAIPHNGNVSNGLMFKPETLAGKPLDRDYNERRARWEPVVEVTQIKGDGEAHPFLSPDDEFADFETWDKGNLNPFATLPKTNDMLQYEYARSALRIGLQEAAKTGANPFKFGMIGSTDAHTSLATGAENDYWGKASAIEPGANRTDGIFFPSQTGEEDLHTYSWEQVASGYAAVWATENTRAAIFDAMQRREVYATTGPRMEVRFFGGWEFADDDHLKPDLAHTGYQKGVPMGGDLEKATNKKQAPRFLVAALRDPQGANLDRIQIIKGWIDEKGDTHEKVYNIAASDNREIAADGTLQPLASTVDLETTTYTNSVGAVQLATVWQDPNFNPEQAAFYYGRVLEIKKPRWSEYDRKAFGYKIPENATREIQDRAYTSPIWYTP